MAQLHLVVAHVTIEDLATIAVDLVVAGISYHIISEQMAHSDPTQVSVQIWKKKLASIVGPSNSTDRPLIQKEKCFFKTYLIESE